MPLKFQGIIDRPSERGLKSMVSNNMIQNWPITASEVTNNHTMFVPNLAGNRGKTVWQNTDRAVTDHVAVPRDFLKLHKFVTIVADVMFVNDTPLLITMSRSINYVTVKHVPNPHV